MSLLGLPVVSYSPASLVYPPDLNYIAESMPDYFAKIEAALANGWSADRLRAAYRWCALEYEYAAVHIHNSFPWSHRRPAARVRDLVQRLLQRIGRQHWIWWMDCRRRQPMTASAYVCETIERCLSTPFSLLETGRRHASAEEETVALRHEVGRLARALYLNAPRASQSSPLRQRLEAFAQAGATP